jgi:hypothetical protein
MGSVYTIILRNLNPKEIVTTGTNIETDNIDNLLTTLSDVYVTILDNGLIAVEGENIKFKSEHTKEFFIAGLTGLKQAKIPSTLKFLLDFLIIQKSRDNNVSMEDLFEMYLLTNIIPNLLPEGHCIKKFIDYLVEFCSSKTQHYQIAKFVKYIDTYKITDCHVLKIAQSIETKKL